MGSKLLAGKPNFGVWLESPMRDQSPKRIESRLGPASTRRFLVCGHLTCVTFDARIVQANEGVSRRQTTSGAAAVLCTPCPGHDSREESRAGGQWQGVRLIAG